MCHDTEFYLRIVGREEKTAFVRNECLADFFAVLVADRNILQVRVARTEASGRGYSLVEGCVYPSRTWVNQLGKCIYIRSQQFFQSAMFQYFFYYGMFVPETFEHFFRGDVLTGFGLLCFFYDLQFVKQYLADLFGRSDIEGFARQFVNLLFDALHLGGEMDRRLFERICIQQHSVSFYVDQYRYERHFDIVKQTFGIVLFQFLLQHIFKFQRYVCIFACVTVDILRVEIAHVFLILSFRTYQFVDVNSLIVKIDFCQIVHSVTKFRLKNIVGDHRIEECTFHLHSVIFKNDHVVLDILSDFQGILIFVDRSNLIDYF